MHILCLYEVRLAVEWRSRRPSTIRKPATRTMSELDRYPELTEFLRDRGHSDAEIELILAELHRKNEGVMVDSIMDSIDLGDFDIEEIIKAALGEK